jgi:recombinational DNA repair protein (RecF pathway)
MICTHCGKDLPEIAFYPAYLERGIHICADCKRKVHREGRINPKTKKYVPLEGEAKQRRKEYYRKYHASIKENSLSLVDEYIKSLQEA